MRCRESAARCLARRTVGLTLRSLLCCIPALVSVCNMAFQQTEQRDDRAWPRQGSTEAVRRAEQLNLDNFGRGSFVVPNRTERSTVTP
jgi:hypothetical protein